VPGLARPTERLSPGLTAIDATDVTLLAISLVLQVERTQLLSEATGQGMLSRKPRLGQGRLRTAGPCPRIVQRNRSRSRIIGMVQPAEAEGNNGQPTSLTRKRRTQ